MLRTFSMQTTTKEAVIDITEKVKAIISQTGITEGTCIVYTPHATAAITINENADPAIGDDLLEALNKIIPKGIWRHDRIDNNGASHLKAAIIGPSEAIPIHNGDLQLGTWQSIMFLEFDGPRQNRTIHVQLITN